MIFGKSTSDLLDYAWIGTAAMSIAVVLVFSWAMLAHAQPPESRLHTIDIKDLLFSPAELTVNTGDMIKWTNKDFVPHTATSNTGNWDSGEITTGQSWETEMAKAGIVDYICLYHPTMTAQIVVTDR